MAEGALFDLVGNVFQLLGSIIVEEVKLASSVKTEIENLTNTVSTIRAVLLDAEKQSSQSHQIKDWLDMLKDVLLDADDLLDDISTQVMRIKMMTKKNLPVKKIKKKIIAEPESESASSTLEPIETKNKLGPKFRNIFKNCNCATTQELELSVLSMLWPWPLVLEFWPWCACVKLRQQT